MDKGAPDSQGILPAGPMGARISRSASDDDDHVRRRCPGEFFSVTAVDGFIST